MNLIMRQLLGYVASLLGQIFAYIFILLILGVIARLMVYFYQIGWGALI